VDGLINVVTDAGEGGQGDADSSRAFPSVGLEIGGEGERETDVSDSVSDGSRDDGELREFGMIWFAGRSWRSSQKEWRVDVKSRFCYAS